MVGEVCAAAEAGVFVFKDGAPKDMLERVKRDDLTAVGLLGEGQKLVLGPISNEQRETLFGSRRGDNSALILPRIGSGWHGSVVLFSDDPSRSDSDMASAFLDYLGQFLVLLLIRALYTRSSEPTD